MSDCDLRAPFPWFGGKSRVAPQVWERFGNVPNYVEPFAGSLAVLLGRPSEPGIETVNDIDCYLANFWRTLQSDPEGLAFHSDWPVNEADLTARHQWLVDQEAFHEHMKTDPDYCDAKIAGWWVWGIAQWIGGGWCDTSKASRVRYRRPHLGDAGQGVNRKRPHLGDAGQGLVDYFDALANRLRRVRVCCGNWKRVCGPSPTVKLGLTGVFLDPPYSAEAGRDDCCYGSNDNLSVAHDVRAWAIEYGNDPLLRIALCGYEGEHQMPDTWECVAWKANGGYSALGNGQGRENSGRERIWFSPHCLRLGLFQEIEAHENEVDLAEET